MSSHSVYCFASVEYKNNRANERINSEIFTLPALNFQFVMKDKVSVHVEPLCIHIRYWSNNGNRLVFVLQWETSVNSLSRLEMHLQQCLDHFPQGEGLESYSFLTLDPNWDMIQRGGIWASRELEVVACLHSNFIQSPSLCEVVVRWVLNS